MLRELIKFISNPKQHFLVELTLRQKILNTISLFFIYLIVIAILTIPIQLFGKIDLDGTGTKNILTIYELIIATLFLAPIYEEFIFRLSLKANTKTVTLSLCALIIFLAINVLKLLSYHSFLSYYMYSPIGIILQIIFIYFSYFILTRILPLSFYKKIDSLISKHFKIYLFILSFLFAISHINLNGLEVIDIYKLFPLTISGYILSFTRLRVGILASLSIHFVNNLISIIPNIFS